MKKIARLLLFLGFIIVTALFCTSMDWTESDTAKGSCSVSYDGVSYALYEDGEITCESTSLSLLIEENAGRYESMHFSSVRCEETLTISEGELTLSGSLSLTAPLVVRASASVVLDGINLSLENGASVQVRGGALELRSGTVVSEGCCISLELSSSSSVSVFGGEIIGRSNLPSINIERGRVTLGAGYVKNENGVAIINRDELLLGPSCVIEGAGYDVESFTPISLSMGTGSFSSAISVRYMSEFSQGLLTEVFFEAQPVNAERITLYDINGREYPLQYFESYQGFTESSFIAVYLPYTLTYYTLGQIRYVEYYLSNEPTAQKESFFMEGFRLLGWYSDSSYTEPFYFGEPLSEDTFIYASYELEPVVYSINDLQLEYDGGEHQLCFSELYHPLSGTMCFEWYDWSGKVVANTETLSLRSVTDSGEYRCRIILSYGEYVSETLTDCIKVEIRKKEVSPPDIPYTYYNGRVQYPEVSDTSVYTVESTGYVDTGVYELEARLVDSVNYKWKDSGSDNLILTFEIKKAENVWVENLKINDIYYGAELAYTCSSRFGTPRLLFSKSLGGEYADNVPCEVGVYYARAVVDGTDNWFAIEGEPVCFSITEDRLVSLSVISPPSKSEYKAFEYFNPEGLLLEAGYSSGRTEEIDGGKAAVHYQSGDSLRAAHSGVFVEYKGIRVLVPVEVHRADYVYDLHFSDTEIIFDGKYHTVTPTGVFPEGKDGVPVKYRVKGGGTDSGSYEVELIFEVMSEDYNPLPSVRATLTVLTREVETRWENTEFIYDGRSKQPSAYYLDINGARIPLSVIGSGVNAGVGYTASAICEDGNYSLINNTVEFKINKADYNLSGIYWTDESFVYDGDRHSVYLAGLPDGISVIGYVNNSAINVGQREARVTVSYDSSNYNEPVISPYQWRIERAEYDLSGIEFVGGEYVFSGEAYYPTVIGEIPEGKDGSRLNYKFSDGIINVEEQGIVLVSFYTDSENYKAPSDVEVRITVKPLGIYVEWQVGEYVYDGEGHIPSAFSTECELRVSGLGYNAGGYTAFAESLNPNYTVLNYEQEYVIRKAENRFTAEPSISDLFYGSEPSPCASALYGEVLYRYFTDVDLKNETDSPREVGKYYALAYVGESDNYSELRGTPLEFQIIAVVPVGIKASLTDREYFAFQSISESDIVCIVVYNDGSEAETPFSSFCIEYECGASLRATDSRVTVRYLDYAVSCPISVSKTELDLSGVIWSGLTHIYDGNIPTPDLSNLPEGVTVREYVGANSSKAGEYTISAILEYDRENYNEPSLLTATLVIEKQRVTPETVFSATYCGKELMPEADSELYYIKERVKMKDVGLYSVELCLFDQENYELTESCAYFCILPITIKIQLCDYTLYWGDRIEEYKYELVEGELIQGDDLSLSFMETDGRIVAILGNKNYKLIQSGGEIEYIAALSPERGRALLYSVLVGLSLVLLVAVVTVRRKRILAFIKGVFKKADTEINTAPILTEVGCEGSELLSVDVRRAESMLTDSAAKALIRKSEKQPKTSGRRKCIINLDTVSANFLPGETVDINSLIEKRLIPSDAGHLKVLGRGILDKPLRVIANRFSLTAVKMIALTGGEAIKITHFSQSEKKRKKG